MEAVDSRLVYEFLYAHIWHSKMSIADKKKLYEIIPYIMYEAYGFFLTHIVSAYSYTAIIWGTNDPFYFVVEEGKGSPIYSGNIVATGSVHKGNFIEIGGISKVSSINLPRYPLPIDNRKYDIIHKKVKEKLIELVDYWIDYSHIAYQWCFEVEGSPLLKVISKFEDKKPKKSTLGTVLALEQFSKVITDDEIREWFSSEDYKTPKQVAELSRQYNNE